jgi:hypothetical protein
VRAIAILTVLVAAAGCGGAAAPSSPPPPAAGAVSGLYLRHASADPASVRPAAGVRIGVFTQSYSTGGPVMADPPKPVLVVRTDARGRFRFRLPDPHRRYFVVALDFTAFGGGTWVREGSRVTLRGCTDCPRPLAAAS